MFYLLFFPSRGRIFATGGSPEGYNGGPKEMSGFDWGLPQEQKATPLAQMDGLERGGGI